MRRGLDTAIYLVTALGFVVAGYLTYAHYAGIDPACGITHGCARVQASDWSDLAGIPVALIGLLGYVGFLVALFAPGENGALAACGLAYVGFGFSAYLTYVEIHTIDAICQWCVANAIIWTALAALVTVRFIRLGSPAP